MSFTLVRPDNGLACPADAEGAEATELLGDRLHGGVVDLLDGTEDTGTADHYTVQWSSKQGFQDFALRNPDAMSFTPGRQLGWPELFSEIRAAACEREVRVYDAGCGFGGVLDELFTSPIPPKLSYLGADIHGSLSTLKRPASVPSSRLVLVRWDISKPLPVVEKFDYIICRATIHHTPKPEYTFKSLVTLLESGGKLAISAYALKGRLRETIDDALRRQIVPLPAEQVLRIGSELAALGRALQKTAGKIDLDVSLDWLGIPAGNYGVHELIYNYVLKCWWNDLFGVELSALVNFDWYHPSYAYRFDIEKLLEWFAGAGMTIERTATTSAQHFVLGRLPACPSAVST